MPGKDNEQPHSSPYKIGDWTVTRLREELKSRKASVTGTKGELLERLEKLDERATPLKRSALPPLSSMRVIELKEELKNRGLSPLGNKDVLIDRLTEDLKHDAKGSVNQETSKAKPESPRSQSTSPIRRTTTGGSLSPSPKQATRTGSRSTTPTKRQSRSISPLRVQKRMQSPQMPLLKHLSGATLHFLESLLAFTQSISLRTVIPFLLGFVVFAIMFWFEGPHTPVLESIQRTVLWYGRWFVFGVIATTAVGPASKTFVRYLIPFVSRVTSVAIGCGSTGFSVHGAGAFKCIDTKIPMDTMSIFLKVYFEVFAWSLGSLVGDLFYYILGYLGRPPRERRIDPKIRPLLLSYDPRIAYVGIALLSLLPEYFSEILAMNAGYFNFPLPEFMWSVLAGRLLSVFSTSLWTIFLFTPGHGEALIKWLHTTNKFTSLFAHPMHHCILKTRAMIATRFVPEHSSLDMAWQATIVLVTVAMTLSAIRSAALKRYYKQD